jgi:hypothetical protein
LKITVSGFLATAAAVSKHGCGGRVFCRWR